MTVRVEGEGDQLVTILTAVMDQATLQGLLRKPYALGLPLLSVSRLRDGYRDDCDDIA